MTSLILCKFPLFSQHLWMLVLGCALFHPVYTEKENWNFECCSRLDLSIFPNWWKSKKTGILCCLLICILCKEKNRSLVCMFSKQIIFWCWIHSFSVCQQILKKTTHCLARWTAKYVFIVSEAIKKAVSFGKFLCLYAMLLLWDNSKHGFSVA